MKSHDMQTTVTSHMPPAPRRTGALLNVSGLAALLLAVARPLFGFEIPAAYLVAAVVFSAVFSVASVPRLVETGRDRHE